MKEIYIELQVDIESGIEVRDSGSEKFRKAGLSTSVCMSVCMCCIQTLGCFYSE